MTNPPPRPGPTGWHEWGGPPPDPATRRLPRPGRVDAPTEKIRRPPLPPLPSPGPPTSPASRDSRGGRGFFTRQTITLLAVIAVAALAGGLACAELYARHRADAVLVGIAECVVSDGATISYGVNPPFLWQHITGHYTNIAVHTAGDRVLSAEGMTADVTLEDVRLSGSGDSKGTIGALDATLTWTAAGIKDTVAANLPGVGALVTDVTTDPSAGTLEMAAGSASVTAKPIVVEGDLNLEVLAVTSPFPKDAVQSLSLIHKSEPQIIMRKWCCGVG